MTDSSTDSPIVLQNVTKQFNPAVRGLDDFSVSFERSKVTVLLGLSGSGKSTLLRHINGLQQPTEGSIRVLGTQIERAGDRTLRQIRRRIGFIFQNFHLVGLMSVLENVCSGRLGSLRGPRLSLMTYPRSLRREAMEQLDRVGLADRAFQRADTLSGGQLQRVAIARALIQRPEILLADEPVASLDPVSSARVIDLISRISREDNLTVVCSLHQVQLAMDFADRIIGLQGGRKVLDSQVTGMTNEDALTIYDAVSHVEAAEVHAAGVAS